MDLDDATTLAHALMAEHSIDRAGWTFSFDEAVQRMGCCRYGKKQISLSRHFTQAASEARVRDVILHEIAHVFVPSGKHDLQWKAVAMRLGADPKACGENPFVTSSEENARRLAAVDGKPYVRIAKARVRGNRYRILRENRATVVLVDDGGGEVRAARSLVYRDGDPEPTLAEQLDIERRRNLDAVAGKQLYRVADSWPERKYAIVRDGRGRRKSTVVNIDTGNRRNVHARDLIPIQETGAQKLGRMVLPRP